MIFANSHSGVETTEEKTLTAKQRKKRKFQKGLSLIEASMVLALSAVVVTGVMYYYQSASDANKLEQTTTEIMSIAGTVQSLYASQPGFKGLNTMVVSATNAVPASLKDEAGGLKTPFGSSIALLPAAVAGVADAGFSIDIEVPKSICVPLATIDFGSSFESVLVGDKGTASFKKLTPAEATAQCAAAFADEKEGRVKYQHVRYVLRN